MELEIKTSLQKVDADINEVLEWKQHQLVENNMPVEQGIADYIYLGMSGMEEEIVKLAEYKKLIDAQIKQIKENKERTSKDIAKWIECQGVDRLNGIAVSSITITKGKEATSENIIKKEFVTELTPVNIEALLIEQGLGYYKEVQLVKTTKATSTKIRINSKKK